MHQLSQFFKAKKKEEMWVPVPPEVPELRRTRDALPLRAPGERCFIPPIVLSLHIIHSGFPAYEFNRHSRCAQHSKAQRYAIALCCSFFSAPSLSTLLALSRAEGRLCVRFSFASQFRIGQPCLRAMFARSLDGFTAAGRPTTSINQRSFKLSPYA